MSRPRLDGRQPLDRLAGDGAAVGDRLRWDGNRWVPAPLVHASVEADGPPTNGAEFWYVTDGTC